MIQVIGNDIYLTRGDSARLQIAITNDSGEPYEVQEGDEVLFTVKKTVADAMALIQKTMTEEGEILIQPADTEGLAFGRYVYDCQLKTAAGDVYTFIPPSLFKLTEEVSY